MADNKYAKLAERKMWKKLRKVAEGKKEEEILQVADVCGTCKCEEAYNILVDMLSRPEHSVQVAAAKNLGKLRYDVGSQKTKLLWIKERTPESDTEMHTALSDALTELRAVKEG